MWGKIRQDFRKFLPKQSMQNILYVIILTLTLLVAVFVGFFVSKSQQEKQAQIIRCLGDDQAIMSWNKAAGQDMEFFAFYRSLEAYKNALTAGNASMVLSPASEFFQYFRKSMR